MVTTTSAQVSGEPGDAHFSVDTGVTISFCDPRSPWQRGSNENTNGLLRQYFPKRSDLRAHTQADLDAVAAELNKRPRQTLGWLSPSQALDEALRRPPETTPGSGAIKLDDRSVVMCIRGRLVASQVGGSRAARSGE
jgi:hypothetical protein